jgi:DNA-binding protein Fis
MSIRAAPDSKGSDPMPQTLREEINDVVTRYLELNLQTSASVDVAAMAREIAQSLVDMVMEQEERQHAPLLAQMITTLGNEYLRRRGLIPTERHDN